MIRSMVFAACVCVASSVITTAMAYHAHGERRRFWRGVSNNYRNN